MINRIVPIIAHFFQVKGSPGNATLARNLRFHAVVTLTLRPETLNSEHMHPEHRTTKNRLRHADAARSAIYQGGAIYKALSAFTNRTPDSQTLTTFYCDAVRGSYAGYTGKLASRSSKRPALAARAAFPEWSLR